MKILIVDDESEQRHFLAELIKPKGQVFEAGSGEEALKIFLEKDPNGVILDFDLGGHLQGDHLLRLMKREKPETVILMVTGYSHLKNQLMSQGADGFMEKPVNLTEVLDFFLNKRMMKK